MFHSRFHNGPILRTTPIVGDISPWGEIQTVTPAIHGITFVSTPGHGGFHVSRERLALMPEQLRAYDGWYEEDCEVAIPMYCFFSEFEALRQVGPNITVKYLEEQIREYFGIEV